MKKQLVAVFLALTVFLAGCGGNTEIGKETKEESEIASEETLGSTEKETEEIKEDTEIENTTPEGMFDFESEDIYGNPVSSEIYGKNKLTLINIFATWCPPCIQELPYLSEIKEDFKDKGVEILGFVTDTRKYDDLTIDEEAMEAAKILYEKSNGNYPYVVPDETFVNGILFVQNVPTSIFLDEKGNIVGDPIIGSRSYDDWKKEIEERLSSL